MAGLASLSVARAAPADALGDIVATFDDERKRRGVPSVSVALVEGGAVSLARRGVRSMSSADPVEPGTRYQAASLRAPSPRKARS